MNRFWKKRTLIWIAVLTLLFGHINAQACVLLYSGGEMTDDGANMFMRSEEINTDDNKVYFVSPAGSMSRVRNTRAALIIPAQTQ